MPGLMSESVITTTKVLLPPIPDSNYMLAVVHLASHDFCQGTPKVPQVLSLPP